LAIFLETDDKQFHKNTQWQHTSKGTGYALESEMLKTHWSLWHQDI